MNKKGFSLIEVAIGLVILAVVVLGIIGMQIASVRGNVFSRYITQATYAAQDGLEALDNLPFTDPGLQPGGPFNDPAGPVTIPGIVFNRSYTVVNSPDNYRIITYTVTWNDGNPPISRQIAFSTVRSQ